MFRKTQRPYQLTKHLPHITHASHPFYQLLSMKFLITADIHGSVNTWMTLQALMAKQDILVVAGDLFDTRYGRYGHPDFDPDAIRKDLSTTRRTVYYVYGNCDEPSFFPGYDPSLTFFAKHRSIFLHHGYPRIQVPSDTDIIIQGHTHIWALEKKHGRIYMNPGSITRPKKGPATFGIMDDTRISILALETGTPLMTLNL